MHKIKKVLITITALGALALGGAALANATGGGSAKNDGPDQKVAGSDAAKAGAAARSAVGGGRVVSVEGSDEGAPAIYEVKVDNGGQLTEVQVDKAFNVTSQKADDDQAESQDTGDGDAETSDD